MTRTLGLLVCLLFLAGCGDQPARVKGELYDNGRPADLPPGALATVVFRPLDSGGRPSETLAYTAVVSPAGAFEYIGTNGELPSGGYQFSIDLAGPTRDKYPHLTRDTSRRRVDLKPGVNLLKIDLANKE